MALTAHLRGLDLWNVQTVRCRGTPGTFWRYCSKSGMYSVKTNGVRGGINTPWKPPERRLPRLKMSLDASALTNLCLWCEFQSRLLFLLSACYLKTFWQPWSDTHIFFKFTGKCSVPSIWSPSHIFCFARKNSVSTNVSYEWADCNVKLEEWVVI